MSRRVGLLAVPAVLVAAALIAGAGSSAATAPTPGGPDAFEPVLGLPATDVTLIGSSPQGAPGETWAEGTLSGGAPASVDGQVLEGGRVLLRHTDASEAWQVVPIDDAAGDRLGFDTSSSLTTARGGLLLLGTEGEAQVLLTRDPGAGAFTAAPTPSRGGPGSTLEPGESLPATAAAAIDEAGGHVGALIVPGPDHEAGPAPDAGEGVLHYDGAVWTREPIEVPGELRTGFTPTAIACGGTAADPTASSPENCWLLATYRSEPGGVGRVALFRRTPSGSTYVWARQPVADWLLGDQEPPAGVGGHAPVSALAGQSLTVTAQGVWVDLRTRTGSAAEPETQISELVTPAPAATPPEPAQVLGRWCYPRVEAVCARTLGAPIPSGYRSFAWPAAPGADAADPGTRLITGLAHGALLKLADSGEFSYVVGAGGESGAGAAFASPQEGWLLGGPSSAGADEQGESQLIEVTPEAAPDQLQEMPVPFRRPLLALASAPGTAPGAGAAIAVGAEGEIGRYTPGQGWRAEALYDSAGKVKTPDLRGVAWPQQGEAYAVGDHGEMWLWRASTGLWEPDPAKDPDFIGNLTAVAFSAGDPDQGYAVGKGGVLLDYGKSWEQVPLPEDLADVSFTSIAFAGGEAIASYRTLEVDEKATGGFVEVGGLAVEEVGDGRHWHVDPAAAALLAELPRPADSVLSKVSGLPDGGAVAAGPGLVIEREGPGSGWHFSATPIPEAQNVSALAAYRDPAGAVRAIASIDLDINLDPNVEGRVNGAFGDGAPAVPPGAPPSLPAPEPLPDTGYLLKETASGWIDLEHMARPALPHVFGQPIDMPARPDPVLALQVDPDGSSGLAVGGQTYDSVGTGAETGFETAAAMRFPASAAPPEGVSTASISTTPGTAAFAVGGDAACMSACSDFANEELGPELSLANALRSAAGASTDPAGGLRDFLYTGSGGGEDVLARVLAGSGVALPVHAPVADAGGGYYSFATGGASGGPVEVIVLDDSAGEVGPPQQAWLSGELRAAAERGEAAIVLGGEPAGAVVSSLLVDGGASAYLYDSPGENKQLQLVSGAGHIPAYGTGTLGYLEPPGRLETDSLASSGFLIVEVETAARDAATNVAPVRARIEPDIGGLALDATNGNLLRRSQVALFEGLARRPPGGNAINNGFHGGPVLLGSEPYYQIPFDCQGPKCAEEVPTDYTFTSSAPDIGTFVAHDPTSANPRQVELGPGDLPVADPHSGLFCAFNAGTTTVSLTTGGLTYSEPVTVQAGSVAYPCGTVPLRNPPPKEAEDALALEPFPTAAARPSPPPAIAPPPAPAPAPAPAPPAPTPPVHPPIAIVPPVPPPALAAPFIGPSPTPVPITPIVPPPPPPPAEPTPPSGTSPVTQPVTSPSEQDEKEAAIEHVQHMSATRAAPRRAGALVAYRRPGAVVPAYLPALIALIALGAAGALRGSRRARPRPAYQRTTTPRRPR